jgi:hypothetical protein
MAPSVDTIDADTLVKNALSDAADAYSKGGEEAFWKYLTDNVDQQSARQFFFNQ